MYLKSLTLKGFKSFATATSLRLEPGITCVVGPNGSGKSNIVDALAWVMGEQGAKTLRGSQMADVIFAGTSARPALGRAEVALTIDNSDGTLPIDYSEVEIRRIMFRGGGSEYYINGVSARLLDVQELLSDTGMGRQMHVIIGQGQLDRILAASPGERRSFIEEAAGVLKHRKRKERALAKLESMAANLTRLEDLTQEINKQLGPLARQAESARQADLIMATVRDASARILAEDAAKLRDQLQVLEEAAKDSEAGRHRASAELRELNQTLQKLQQCERENSGKAQELTRNWQRLTAVRERLRSTLALASERQAQLQTPLVYTGENPVELEQKAASATAADAKQHQLVLQLTEKMAQAEKACQEAKQNRDDLAARLAATKNAARAHAQKRGELEQRLSAAKSRYEGEQDAVKGAEAAVESAQNRLVAAKTQVGPIPKIEDEGWAKAHRQASETVTDLREQVRELTKKVTEVRAEVAHWLGRRDALAASATFAKANLEAHQTLGPLAPMLEIEPGYEKAVGIILGDLAGATVVAGSQVATTILDNTSGEVVLVIAEDENAEKSGDCEDTGITGNFAGLGNEDDAQLPEKWQWASHLVRARTPQIASFVRRALAGVVVAPHLQAKLPVGVRQLVTPEGATIGRRFARRSGAAPGAGVLEIQAAMEDAATKATSAEQRLGELRARMENAQTQLETAEAGAKVALEKLRAGDARQAEIAKERARALAKVDAAQGEVKRAQTQLARARKQLQEFACRAEEAENALREFAAKAAPGTEVNELEEDLARAVTRFEEQREKTTDLRIALKSGEEQQRMLAARARTLRQNAATALEKQRSVARAESARKEKYAKIASLQARAASAAAAATKALQDATAARENAEKENASQNTQVQSVRQKIEAVRQNLDTITAAAHQSELTKAQVESAFTQVADKASETFGLQISDLIDQFGPHLPVPTPDHPEGEAYVRATQEKRLRRAKRELRALGKVNPLALEQHAALEERHKFLASQLADLKASRRDLLEIIDTVDGKVRAAFASAFADTRAAYQHVFGVLFPGGEGDLVLTDPTNMLETGIEIEARPAGKRVKQLSLLSGGERSLAAMALLVAIFQARPSPFYVMDEVEAALDDANLARLLEVFKELQQSSQLIVITHQKRTMEIADALYGVTMQAGVTTVISQKLVKNA
ncbi:MAG: chromosome segregation protein SMC [Actinomycetaceae bacterium]|nr:chromosome segregation protein SMC [Actinomycetaceae bacterium]